MHAEPPIARFANGERVSGGPVIAAVRHLCSDFWSVQMFKNLIPTIFNDRLQDGIEFFVDGLGFEVLYQDADMAVISPDGAKYRSANKCRVRRERMFRHNEGSNR